MDGLNTCTISGNLCRDPELKATSGGMAVLSLSVAVNESRKVNGEWEDVASFVDVTMFGKRAEGVSRYLSKGTYVAVTGKLRQDRWEGKDGSKRSKLYVVADNIHFESRQQRPAPQEDFFAEDCPF